MFNKDLSHTEERKLILSSLRGVIKFGGEVEIDDDDENGNFTLTQTYYDNLEQRDHIRVIRGTLLVTQVEDK